MAINPTGSEPSFLGPDGKPLTAASMEGPPLSPNDPWVRALASLFPGVPLGEIAEFAGAFRSNMFSAMNSQIKRDEARARKAAQKMKEAIEGTG